MWWTAIKGAARYLTGPRRPDPAQAEVAGKCAACPNLKLYREDELHGLSELSRLFVKAPLTGWCGEPMKQTANTCGCLCVAQAAPTEPHHATITVAGQPVSVRAAGKTTVESERCTSGEW